MIGKAIVLFTVGLMTGRLVIILFDKAADNMDLQKKYLEKEVGAGVLPKSYTPPKKLTAPLTVEELLERVHERHKRGDFR